VKFRGLITEETRHEYCYKNYHYINGL